MKITCKRGASLFGFFLLVLPMMALATAVPVENRQVVTEAKKAGMPATQQETFCSRFNDRAKVIATTLAERKGQFDRYKNNQTSTREEGRSNRDALLEDQRSEDDQKRSEIYTTLGTKVTTEAEKSAVADFESTVEKAVGVRQAVVDDTVAAFRRSVDTAVAGRKNETESAVEKFQSAVKEATAKAQSSCNAGTDPALVRSTFRSSLEANRFVLKTDRGAAEKVGMQVKSLAETRRVTIKKALDDFRTTVKVAQEKLKKVFGEVSTP